MKNNFNKIIGILFLVGILLCGIGCGIFAAEIYSFDYVTEESAETELKTQEIPLKFPANNQPVYYNDIEYYSSDCQSFKVTNDDTVEKGNIKYIITYTGDYENFEIDIDSKYYIYDSDSFYVSEHSVNSIKDLSYNYSQKNYDGFSQFKRIVNDFKHKKIVNYVDNSSYSVEIKINPADASKLIKLNDSQSVITYREYIDVYKAEIDSYRNSDNSDSETVYETLD